MITTVLFDLDGTLLPMDNDEFVKYYFGLLCKKAAPRGYEPEKLIDTIWTGTAAMVKNDGSKSNEEAFWDKFCEIMGEEARKDIDLFDDFYRNEFNGAKAVCGYNQNLIDLVHELKKEGKRIILATNPIFPEVATLNRIEWAGFSRDDFELITTYENIGFSKPNPEYYREILRRINVPARECLMIGNDAKEDMIASEVGIKVYLLTDHLINKENIDISVYPNGDYTGIRKLLEEE